MVQIMETTKIQAAQCVKQSTAADTGIQLFKIRKCRYEYRKAVYKGLRNNENRLYAMFARICICLQKPGENSLINNIVCIIRCQDKET